MRLIRQRTKEPTTCMACLRRSMGVGLYEPRRKTEFAWTCDDTACIAATRRMLNMAQKDLDAFEAIAAAEAGKAVAPELVILCMGALWDAGVRNLENVSNDQMSLALDQLHVSGAIYDEIRKALEVFAATIRDKLTAGEAPF